MEMIAAQGVESFLVPVGRFQGTEVVRVAIVVEDDLLVEFAQLGHQPRTSRTLPRADTRASTS